MNACGLTMKESGSIVSGCEEVVPLLGLYLPSPALSSPISTDYSDGSLNLSIAVHMLYFFVFSVFCLYKGEEITPI